MVHWISSKCMENFHSYCFICMERAQESHGRTEHLSGKPSRFIENPQKLQNFSLVQLLSLTNTDNFRDGFFSSCNIMDCIYREFASGRGIGCEVGVDREPKMELSNHLDTNVMVWLRFITYTDIIH